MKTEAKILICYNAPVSVFSVYSGKPLSDYDSDNDLSEKNLIKELQAIQKKLEKYFTHVKTLAVDRNIKKLIESINSYSPDAIFNFVESVEGIAAFEKCIAGLFDLLAYQYTGNNPITLGNCLDKARTKEILNAFKLKTPNFLTLLPREKFTRRDITLDYPIILKLLKQDASIGISEFSVVNNYSELRKQFRFLADTYNEEIILEEYIKGRELNVAILGDKVLPISEINFTGLPAHFPKIVTYDGKWMENSLYFNHTIPVCPANINSRMQKRINALALKAFNALGCRDYARVDIRLTNNNIPYIIEVNPNPDISSDSGFARAAKAAGIDHSELLFTIANFALERKRIYDTKNKVI